MECPPGLTGSDWEEPVDVCSRKVIGLLCELS